MDFTDIPPFRLILPAGWEESPADGESVAALIERGRAVFKSQHRPDLDSEFSQLMGLSLRKMKQAGVFALYLQTAVPADKVLPLSITAALAHGQLGGTLDRQVSALFREQSAQFLTDDHTIVHWQSDVEHTGRLSGSSSRNLSYLVPIPGTQRRSAVQFTTTIPYPTGDDAETEDLLDDITLLSDTIISTFAWEPSAS
ncbi:hypothetical protein D9V29_05855 [Mycetocola manganoxydans]|uniref:Uncharacterized protein n=1 Tax=Mycetocola manganoxydans TaxID=699879 RepID=A0A3L6ZVX7_9MICO|nr:hypothetical protein [Mycetocola manganoxydans]RLP71958.1 hypothetical protein D9V29_05855 [Mycetocola manganoxydans]GHD47281.1 hypothetical protein GCM10008097_18030 [Mycetocola manganoxydans]